MSAFSDAIDVIYADPNLSKDATYFESEDDAEGTDVRVVTEREDKNAGLFRTDAVVDGHQIAVRVSEVSVQPLEGSRFELADEGSIFGVRTSRAGDGDDDVGLEWICDVDEIAAGS